MKVTKTFEITFEEPNEHWLCANNLEAVLNTHASGGKPYEAKEISCVPPWKGVDSRGGYVTEEEIMSNGENTFTEGGGPDTDAEQIVAAQIETNFKYHPPRGGQADKYKEIRALAKIMAGHYNENCPHSRELSLAITKLEESVMWANASIARHEQ